MSANNTLSTNTQLPSIPPSILPPAPPPTPSDSPVISATATTVLDIVFILDESGSMESMGTEPVQSVNSFIEEQKKNASPGSKFSLWTFNSTVTNVIDDVDLQQVGLFTSYKPENMTSLYDALGKAITTKKNKSNKDNVICVVLTDGQENSSQEYNKQSINSLISEMETKHKWKFIYLGANHEVFASAGGIGISPMRCAAFECKAGGILSMTRGTSEAIKRYKTASSQDPNAELTLDGTECATQTVVNSPTVPTTFSTLTRTPTAPINRSDLKPLVRSRTNKFNWSR